MANESERIWWSNNVITRMDNNPNFNFFGEFNKACVIGIVEKDLEISHVFQGEKFFRTKLSVERLSETKDFISLIVPETVARLETMDEITGKCVMVFGQYRSYNKVQNDSRHLELFLFARKIYIFEEENKARETLRELCDCEDDTYTIAITNNLVYLDGYLCKNPEIRKTPLGHKISNLLVAVNRSYGKSDYLPCIAWEAVAEWTKRLEVGNHVRLYARIQSRDYYKRFLPCSNHGEWRETYELSVIRVNVVE